MSLPQTVNINTDARSVLNRAKAGASIRVNFPLTVCPECDTPIEWGEMLRAAWCPSCRVHMRSRVLTVSGDWEIYDLNGARPPRGQRSDDGPGVDLRCRGCGGSFRLSNNERDWFAEKGYTSPKRCLDCRKKRRDVATYAERGSI